MKTRPHIIQLDHICKSIQEQQILQRVTFSIGPGSILGILGANGAGKTTLLRIMTGLISPDAGELRIDGERVNYDRYCLRYKIGYMPEDGGLYKRLTVFENLKFFLDFYGRIPEQDHRIERVLDKFGLLDRRDDTIGKLSGGMRRKLLFLRSILHKPSVLLLDEPFSGLDIAARQNLMTVIRDLSGEGCITCISSHAADELARLCNMYLFIRKGRMLLFGRIEDISPAQDISGAVDLTSVYMKAMQWK